ncbi:MAG TPA: methyl-accepting chemotaxis protein [Thermoanaerobaculia bacterium]|nr:methyl-accepting chemotaxis protein [Thermoanaerobaculia bacterium]
MNLNIRGRLFAGFFTVVVLGTLVCTLVLQLLTTSIRQLENVVSVADNVRQYGMKLRFDMMTMSDSIRGYLLDPTAKSELERKRAADDEFSRDIAEIKRLAPGAEVLSLIDKAEQMDSQSVNRLEDEVLELVTNNKIDEAKKKYIAEYLPVRHEQEAVIRQMEETTEKGAAQALASAQSRYATVRLLTYILDALLVIAGAILSSLIAGSIAKPIVRMAQSAKRAAAGDVTDTLEFDGRTDELGELSRSMNVMYGYFKSMVSVAERMSQGDFTANVKPRSEDDSFGQAFSTMLAKLNEVIGEVRTSANALATASGQVSQTAQTVSSGTSQQASAIQETTASLEQMNASISQNADNSRTTGEMAGTGAADAQESGDAVLATVEAMKAIAGKINVIEEIAYQTNLLALNAAIEAARASDHGRGFAVVANEVRKLAEKSQLSSREISALAAQSVGIADRSGSLLTKLVPSIRKTAELVNEIAAASVEQSAGVAQINKSVTQVDLVTQRNASAAEELAATAEEMAAQAEGLQALVDFFRTGDQRSVSRLARVA